MTTQAIRINSKDRQGASLAPAVLVLIGLAVLLGCSSHQPSDSKPAHDLCSCASEMSSHIDVEYLSMGDSWHVTIYPAGKLEISEYINGQWRVVKTNSIDQAALTKLQQAIIQSEICDLAPEYSASTWLRDGSYHAVSDAPIHTIELTCHESRHRVEVEGDIGVRQSQYDHFKEATHPDAEPVGRFKLLWTAILEVLNDQNAGNSTHLMNQ